LSRLNKPQPHFRTLAPKPPLVRQVGKEVGLETWRGQTQRTPSDRLNRPPRPPKFGFMCSAAAPFGFTARSLFGFAARSSLLASPLLG